MQFKNACIQTLFRSYDSFFSACWRIETVDDLFKPLAQRIRKFPDMKPGNFRISGR